MFAHLEVDIACFRTEGRKGACSSNNGRWGAKKIKNCGVMKAMKYVSNFGVYGLGSLCDHCSLKASELYFPVL